MGQRASSLSSKSVSTADVSSDIHLIPQNASSSSLNSKSGPSASGEIGKPHSNIVSSQYSVASVSSSSLKQHLTDTRPDRSDPVVGVKCISSCYGHSLLLTYSGDVYGWGYNHYGQVFYTGPEAIKLPIKLPLTNIISISAGVHHSLALSSEGILYGWGWNRFYQINNSINDSLPITSIEIPHKCKDIFIGTSVSFALTEEGHVVKWRRGKSFEVFEELNSIVCMFVAGNSFFAIDSIDNFYYYSGRGLSKIPVTQYLTPRKPLKNSVSFGHVLHNKIYLLVADTNGDVWRFVMADDKDSFNNKPIKVPGLSNIDFVFCHTAIQTAVDYNGQVFAWGNLRELSDVFGDEGYCKTICLEALTKIEGVSLGHDFLFAYNKNTVWAWGRNDKGQLGTADLIDRPQPVKLFGSEILGSFQYPKQPLDRMYNILIKLIYYEYLKYLSFVFGYSSYVKARFCSKCCISERVARLVKDVFDGYPIQTTMFLIDPRKFNFNLDICDLHLRLTVDYKISTVINTRLRKITVHYDEVDYDPYLLSHFPNVEVVKLDGRSYFNTILSINLAHLSNLKCLELDYPFEIDQLPTSLVKLVLKHRDIEVADLSNLTSLKELVVLTDSFSSSISKERIVLSQSIATFEVHIPTKLRYMPHLGDSIYIGTQLLNMKELIIHKGVPADITEQNFPSLRLIQLIGPDRDSLSDSFLSPTKLISHGLIKSVKLIKNEYLVELSCFPWWIKYPITKYLLYFFREYMVEDEIT
ncbi:hypothetical protein P9112_010171 [Eukaryota sp. TZLM1-RC]